MEVSSPQSGQPAQQASHEKDQHYLVMHGRTLKCVCELCTCGKHRCPRPRVKGDFQTSYGDHYKDIKMGQQSTLRPDYKYEQRHYNPETLRTSYQDNYIRPPQPSSIEQPPRMLNYGNKVMNHVPFMGVSSYKDQYQPFVIRPNNPEESAAKDGGLGVQHLMPRVKFQGISSYKSQYVEPPKARSTPIPQTSYQRVQVPFYGTSSYKKDYPEYQLKRQAEPQDSNAMSKSHVLPTVKFQGSTSYKDQFQGYRIPDPQMSPPKHTCIVEKLNVPSINYINDKHHIYFDEQTNKFL